MYLQGVPFGFAYWVVSVGPATYGPAGLYQYAVVSDPLQLSLFVLARNVTDYFSNYDYTVQQWLSGAGFTTAVNSPIATVQSNCTYPGV